MTKVLSKSGDSLADTYDVVGSVAGIEQLRSEEITLVHEMGATLWSERFSTFIRRAASGDIAQSTNFDVVLDGLPAHIFRILGLSVFVDTTARVTLATVSIQEPITGREVPIWIWDAATDIEVRARFSIEGAGATTEQFLQPAPANVRLPHMMASAGQPQSVPNVTFRGQTASFGAGTVEAVLLMHVGFVEVGGLSSRGLPVPSW